MTYRTILAAAAFAALAACASTPSYGPAAAQGGTGYYATQIGSDRYAVTYRAADSANAQLISDYALLRAADLTLEHNHDWFWVVRRTVEGEDSRRSGGFSIGVGVGAGSYGRHGGASVGVGTSVPIGGQVTGVARAVTLEIRFGTGPKPDDVNAYDARAVATNLRSRIAR
ncbi:MAG: hypothetical protein R3C16_01070 [Hyphomonadaceae bacterium]